MPREIICPHCGARLPIDDREPSVEDQEEGSIGSRTVEMVLPATVSFEGLPAFEGFQDFDFKVQESIIDSRSEVEVIRFGDSEIVELRDRSDILEVEHLGLPRPQDPFSPRKNGSGSGSSEKLAVISQLDLSDPVSQPSTQQVQAASEATGASEDALDDHEPDDRPSAWPIALLTSYASVITLVCLWLWWNGQPSKFEAEQDDFWVVEEGPDPGIRATQSVRFEPVPKVPAELQIPLGKKLEVGPLEIVPQTVSTGSVILKRVRVDGQAESREGEPNVLKLRIRLRNTSSDLIFAPLDEAFLRDPDHKLPDSFLEDASGQRIYSYELPVYSEWAIQGQEFRELRPGELMEGVIVSAAILPQKLNGPLIWRIRLRTGPDQTEYIAVEFQADEILDENEA